MPMSCGMHATCGAKRKRDKKLTIQRKRIAASKSAKGSYHPDDFSPSDWRKLIVKANIENSWRIAA